MDIKNTRKIHNPKSHAPAVYIPCWLIQVPNKLLSYAAKCLYGRLSQWSNESGDVYRSYNQLAQEIGSTQRSVNEYLRELRECGLIDTTQPQKGGLNHFIFYDHEWMYEPLNKALCYKSEDDPEQNPALPPRAESCSTPEQNPARINNKEIKDIKIKELINCAPARDSSLLSFIKTRLSILVVPYDEDVPNQIAFYAERSSNKRDFKETVELAVKLVREKKWQEPYGWKKKEKEKKEGSGSQERKELGQVEKRLRQIEEHSLRRYNETLKAFQAHRMA